MSRKTKISPEEKVRIIRKYKDGGISLRGAADEVGVGKTEDSVRFIKMPVQTMNLLRMWKKQCDMLRITNLEFWNDTGYVLIQDNGEPIHPQSVSRWFERFCARNDLPKTSLHKLRHTSASILIESGASITTVGQRLGHSQISTTLDVYSHQIKKRDAAAAEDLGKVLYLKKAKNQIVR